MADWCIGIDLGGTAIKFGLFDGASRLEGAFQLPTPTEQGGDGVAEQMVAGARRLMAEQHLPPGAVLGVGIGSPGPLSISRGVIHAMPNIPGMDDFPLRDRVADALGLPAALENDANAAALGEFICGAGRDVRDMVLLTLGTGIGSGIILDGNILHGAHEIGGELGHMIVDPQGEPCDCGQQGCLEACCSAKYLVRAATRKIRQDGVASSLRAALDVGRRLGAKEIQSAAEAGDELAAELWDRAARFLALGCVNVCRIFDPEQIVLAGGMAQAGSALVDPVRAHFEALHWRLTQPRTQIVLSSLGADAGVIGAAGVAWQAFAST